MIVASGKWRVASGEWQGKSNKSPKAIMRYLRSPWKVGVPHWALDIEIGLW